MPHIWQLASHSGGGQVECAFEGSHYFQRLATDATFVIGQAQVHRLHVQLQGFAGGQAPSTRFALVLSLLEVHSAAVIAEKSIGAEALATFFALVVLLL